MRLESMARAKHGIKKASGPVWKCKIWSQKRIKYEQQQQVSFSSLFFSLPPSLPPSLYTYR